MHRKFWLILFSMMLVATFTLTACTSGSTGITTNDAGDNTSSTQVSGTPQPPDDQTGMGNPPQGTPPANGVQPPIGQPPIGSNQPPDGGGQPPMGGSSPDVITTVNAGATVDGIEESGSNKTYTASDQDTSAIFVTNSGKLTLTNAVVKTTGNTSSTDNSSFYGLNAAILVNQGAALSMTGGSVTTSGTGANGVFSSGEGSNVVLNNVTISATGDGGHAVMATRGGSMTLSNVDMTTLGGSASAIATDRGGGTITVIGGTVSTTGNNSAGIYSTGNISVSDTKFTSSGAEAAVVEGANSITLTNVQMTSTYANKWGVMIYQSMSGDAEGSEGKFTMTGGSLAYQSANGPLFYVTNSTAVIQLSDVDLDAASGVLIKAAAGNWGNTGENGGTVLLTANQQDMLGDMVADSISTLSIMMENGSTLKGAINSANSAKSAALTLDASCIWNVIGDSYLTILSDSGAISGNTVSNIIGNGHTVYYNAASNPALGGKTYSLTGGGTLEPLITE